MSTNMDSARTDALLGGIGITEDQARGASLVLAGHAAGADELRLWLEICGLLPYEPGGHFAPCGRRSTAKGDKT